MSYSHEQYIFVPDLKIKHPHHRNSNLKRTLGIIQMMTLRHEGGAGFLNLGTVTFWARYFFVTRGCPVQLGCSPASLVSTYQIPVVTTKSASRYCQLSAGGWRVAQNCPWMRTTEVDKAFHCWCLVPQSDRETLEARYQLLMGISKGSALLVPQARMPASFSGWWVVVGSHYFIKSPCVNKCFLVTI